MAAPFGEAPQDGPQVRGHGVGPVPARRAMTDLSSADGRLEVVVDDDEVELGIGPDLGPRRSAGGA